LALSALVALREELQSNSRMKNGKAVHSDAKSTLGGERQAPKLLKNQGLRVS